MSNQAPPLDFALREPHALSDGAALFRFLFSIFVVPSSLPLQDKELVDIRRPGWYSPLSMNFGWLEGI